MFIRIHKPLLFFLITFVATLGTYDLSAAAETSSAPLPFLMAHAPKTNTVHPFTTDGCSFSMDRSLISKDHDRDWTHCCTEHDIAHWQGGTDSDRLRADERFRSCLQKVGGPAKEYFVAVQSLGHPRIKQILSTNVQWNFPWGYGWNYLSGFDPLNIHQQESVCRAFADWEETLQFDQFVADYKAQQGVDPVLPECFQIWYEFEGE